MFSNTRSVSAWIGIDGDTCSSAILQTGLDFTVSCSAVSYYGASSSLLTLFTC